MLASQRALRFISNYKIGNLKCIKPYKSILAMMHGKFIPLDKDTGLPHQCQ
jgi:hypothetical protein